MARNRILLIYPKLGISGALVQHMPLSLLYAAVDSIKAGFDIDIADVRLNPGRWKEEISSRISGETILAGISVMTGAPIKNALEISRWLKKEYPWVRVVWGGPHTQFNGQQILGEPSIDYVIAGYGSLPLSRLAENLRGEKGIPLSSINGLLYRENGSINCVEAENKFEFIDYRDIPYHLIEGNLGRYGQLDSKGRFFSLYSVMGCPYECAFCSSPAQYRNIRVKYEKLPPEEVADHIEYVQKNYGATYIYFIDDDSFADLGHVQEIIKQIRIRGLKVKLGFRGARINEIKKMSDDYLRQLADAGTNIMHVGAESGSQRMLDLMKKNCTVEDIIEVNKKMARHPEIKTAYNWIVGLPGETIDDLRKTQKLMLALVRDNPNAIVFTPNKYRPLPGTELYELALRHEYKSPEKLEGWVNVEVEGDYMLPWYNRKMVQAIDMMRITSFFIDDKVFKVETGNTFRFRLIRMFARIYAPLAKLRLRRGFSGFLFEQKLFQWFAPLFSKI